MAVRQLGQISCIICAGVGQYWGERNSFLLYRCVTCRTVFPHPLPTPEQTLAIYSQDYFSGATQGSGYVDYDRDKQPMIPTFQHYLDRIEAQLPSKGLMLDVGAATGFFLRLAAACGWNTMGIEPSGHAAAVWHQF